MVWVGELGAKEAEADREGKKPHDALCLRFCTGAGTMGAGKAGRLVSEEVEAVGDRLDGASELCEESSCEADAVISGSRC